MNKKTASKTSPKPAARAPRAQSEPARSARQATSGGRSTSGSSATREKRASTPPAKAASAARKPSARAATKPAATSGAVAPAKVAPAKADEARASETASKGSELVERIVQANDGASVSAHAEHLTSDKPTTATASARVLDELLARKPEMLVPAIDKLVQVVTSGPKRSVQTAAAALPVMARLAPARVARHLPTLTERFSEASDIGKDGLVSTFAALCTASVAYQKRLEPVLEVALSGADPKTLQRWTEIVLPSLKGEPHARARAVVEERLNQIPRQHAQPIATFLGIKLRPAAMR